MSDDEDFYDEYDEDIFWVEEPDPTVAVCPHPLFIDLCYVCPTQLL